jgi:hypothetical protein
MILKIADQRVEAAKETYKAAQSVIIKNDPKKTANTINDAALAWNKIKNQARVHERRNETSHGLELELGRNYKTAFNKVFEAIALVPPDAPEMGLHAKGWTDDNHMCRIVMQPLKQDEPPPPPPPSPKPDDSIGLKKMREFILDLDKGPWDDRDVDAAVRARMIMLDKVSPQRERFLTAYPEPLTIDRPIMKLAHRMRELPESLRFIVHGVSVVGYVSATPVVDEGMFLNVDFYTKGQLDIASGGSEVKLPKSDILFVSSCRLHPDYRNDTYSNRRARALAQMLIDLADAGRLFSRVYIITHDDKADGFIQNCALNADKETRRAHASAEESLQKALGKKFTPLSDPPLWRLHLRPWCVADIDPALTAVKERYARMDAHA